MRQQRRINFTGRKRIDKGAVTIRLFQPDPLLAPSFSAEVDLSGHDLAGDAEVFVEAYHKATTQRFSMGTVDNLKPPQSSVIDEVDLGGRLLFRVKVVDNATRAGRLLASVSGVSPEDQSEDDGRDFLIKVKALELESVPWELELSPDGSVKPILELNFRIPDAINVLRHNAGFQSLILPAAMREIYWYIYRENELDVDEDSWQEQWLRFGYGLTGREPPDSINDSSEMESWTDLVVSEFSRKHGLVSRLASAMTEGK